MVEQNATSAPSQKSSGTSTCLVILASALITFIVTTVVVGAGVYYWQKGKCDSGQSASTSKEDAATPTEVTENFILATLGTVPSATIDYDKAKTYLSENQKSFFTDDSYVPMFYGIQEGPDSYKVISEYINGDTATVRIDAVYGEMMTAWAFTLIWEDGAWKIDSFRDDAQ
jgi:hypothetical protein